MKDKILADLTTAMKAQDKEKLSVLRMVKGAMLNERIKLGHELDDTEMSVLIGKEVKSRKESIAEFEKGNRQDLIEETEKEIAILNEYMPKQMSEDEIKKEIDKSFDKLKPESMKDMGKVMGELNPILKGKADMGLVSTLIRNKLTNL